MNHKGIAHPHLLLILSLVGVVVYFFFASTLPVKNQLLNLLFPKSQSDAAGVRGQAGDLWADIVLGQPDFGQNIPGEKTNFKVAGPGGVVIDRSATPQRVYVFDGMNSRILGYSSLGVCQNNNSISCTSDSDCGGSTCTLQVGGVNGSKKADLVLGQPDFTRGACNGDGTGQLQPNRQPASAATLCSQREGEHSPFEGGSSSQMAVDALGNLYVTDFHNNRVLKYNSPFTTDTVADEVWGQADFTGNVCNRGQSTPDGTTLCFDAKWGTSGVDVDIAGNLWVADNGNNRVLRFPSVSGVIAKTADLVLGQTNLTSNNYVQLCSDIWNAATCANLNTGLDRLYNPVAVRVGDDGKVYVVDTWNHRIVAFDNPATGATGRLFVSTGLRLPSGLTFDTVNGGIWVNNTIHDTDRLVLYGLDGVQKKVIGPYGVASIQMNTAGVGVTKDGDILVSSSEGIQDVWYYKHPIQDSVNSFYAKLFYPPGGHNYISNKGLTSARGIVIKQGQLIVSDAYRIAFWNIPNGIADLSDFKSYDGVAGVAGFSTPATDPSFFRISGDDNGNLWAIRGQTIQHFSLPLTLGEMPDKVISTRDFKILGSTTPVGLDFDISSIYADKQGRYLWLSSATKSRAFRIRLPANLTGDFIIDTIIGGSDIPVTTLRWEDGGICATLDPNLLCYPGAVVEDNNRHLYISDMFLEFHGTKKLYRFDSNLFPLNNPSLQIFYNDSAAQKFDDVAAWEPTFDSTNRMVAGLSHYGGMNYNNGYNAYRKPLFVDNMMAQNGPTLVPSGGVLDVYSQPFNSAFDSEGNLYIADLNWGRVLIYRSPFNLNATPVPTSTPTPTPVPTPGSSLPSGLVAYWPMDEASGATVAEMVSNFTGVANSVTNITTGILGQARSFDGNQNILISNAFKIPTPQGSVSLWVKPNNWGASADILGAGVSNNDFRLFIYGNGTASAYGFFISGEYRVNTGVDGIPALNNWTHFVLTWDSSGTNVYLNGVQKGNRTPGAPLFNQGNNPLVLGHFGAGLQGVLDEVSFWNKPLNQTEVNQLYNNGLAISPFSIGATPAPVIGDLNGDSKVGIADLSTFLSNWGATSSNADLDGNGSVGIGDLSIFLSNWTG